MTIQQVKEFYEDKKDIACPITERLIMAGYQQEQGGYIKYAYEKGKEVDYRKAEPNQGWHLLVAYCDNKSPNDAFTRRIVCGELIFWMAEVGTCVDKCQLEELANVIIASGTPVKRRNEKKSNIRYNRRKWNREIQELCYDKIVETIETYTFKTSAV